MPLPVLDPNTPSTRTDWYGVLDAVRWALASACCSGWAWAIGVTAGLSLLNKPLANDFPPTSDAILVMALGGAGTGLIGGAFVGLIGARNRRGTAAQVGALVGALAVAIGGALTIPVMHLCARWVHPLISSSLLWVVVGLLVGLVGYNWSRARTNECLPLVPPDRRGMLGAAGWAFAAAGCSGGMWAGVLVVVRSLFDVSFPDELRHATAGTALLFAAFGAGFGLLVGAVVGLRPESDDRLSVVLLSGIGAGLFGALAGGLSVLTAGAVGPRLHPLVSSSLAMTAVGFVAGLCGYVWSHRAVTPIGIEADDEEDADRPPGPKVEWLLYEPKRPWRINRALLRVLPVLVVACAALVGAALRAPAGEALALLAVGALGAVVARVLYRQEKRLEVLERQLRKQMWLGAHDAPAVAGSHECASSNSPASASVTAAGASTGAE